jgi:hypothetical protein
MNAIGNLEDLSIDGRTRKASWGFQTLAVVCIINSSFWFIPQSVVFVGRCFGTPCYFQLMGRESRILEVKDWKMLL